MNIGDQEKLKIRHLKIHDKTKGDIIVLQPDTLALFAEAIKNHASKKAGALASLGITLTLLLALLTNQAKNFLGISGTTWQAVIILGLIVAVGFTIKEGWGFVRSPLWNKDPVKWFLENSMFKEIPEDSRGDGDV